MYNPAHDDTKGEERPTPGAEPGMKPEDQLARLIEAAKREDPDGKMLMAAAMSHADMEWLLGTQGQLEAGKIVQEITERLRNLPEAPIIGIFFGVVTAESKDSNAAGTMLEADGFSTAWGMPQVVTNAIKDMVMKTIVGNAKRPRR